MIVELDANGVEQHVDELAQLLLDAHADGMALGLAGPLSHESAAAAYREAAVRLAAGERALLAVFEAGAVVGAVQLDRAAGNGRHRAELRRLVVSADHRGRGIGTALMSAAVAKAREWELRLLWLTTHENTKADDLYAHLGWTRAGVIPSYAELPDGTLAGNAFYYLEL